MATVEASGVTDVTLGYEPILYSLDVAGTYFMKFYIEEVSLQFPRKYADFHQIAFGLPDAASFAVIHHQAIWIDVVELTIRRDYGPTFTTVPSFRWYVSGLSWELLKY